MRFERFDGLPPQERERLIKEEVGRFHAFLYSPEGKRIMNSGTPQEVFALLSSMPPLLREHIAGTSFDIPKEQWPSVVVGGAGGVLVTLKVNSGPDRARSFHVGNGVYVGPNEFLTNLHVLQSIVGPLGLASRPGRRGVRKSSSDTMKGRGFDVVRVKASPSVLVDATSSGPPKIVEQFSSHAPDSLLNGSLITVAGIDPDESSSPDGTKLFPSVALQVTKHMAHMFAGDNLDAREHFENSYIYLMPPGEVRRRHEPSRSGSRFADLIRSGTLPDKMYWYAGGTSGSPVMMNGTLAGINYAGKQWEQSGVTLDLGFFHPMGKIREALKLGMNYDMTRT